MAILKHKVWIDSEGLPGLCHAGPEGAGFRALQGEGARLVAVIEASCRFEAMTKYFEMLGRGAYVTNDAADYEAYPEALRRIQEGA